MYYFLKYPVLIGSATCEATRIQCFYARYQVPLYLDCIKPLVNCCKTPKYFVQVCVKVAVLLSTSLIINHISENSSIFAQKKSFFLKNTTTKN